MRDECIKKTSLKNKGLKWKPGQSSKLKASIEKKIKEGTWHTSFSKKRIKEYGGVKFDGSWEMKLAIWFDEHNVKWVRNTESFQYEFEGKTRRYFPDFYLPDIDCFVEVKGWRVPKDEAKWKQFPHRLVTLSGKDLVNLGIDIGSFRDWRKQ